MATLDKFRTRKSYSEPVVGDPYERLLETTVNLARRIEKVKLEYESLKKMEGGKYITPRERNERLSAIKASMGLLMAQTRGFARNRGNERDLMETLEDIRYETKNIRREGRSKAARDYWITEMLSEIERWLEENHLLLNVAEPQQNFTEELWDKMVHEALAQYLRDEHAQKKVEAPSEMESFDKALEELEDEDGEVSEDGDAALDDE